VCVLQILIGLVFPPICFIIKFGSDEAEGDVTVSRNEVEPSTDVTVDVKVTIPAGNAMAMTSFNANATNKNNETDKVADGGGEDGEPTKSKRKKLDFLTGHKRLYALYYYYTSPVVKFCYCLVRKNNLH